MVDADKTVKNLKILILEFFLSKNQIFEKSEIGKTKIVGLISIKRRHW